MGRIKTKYVKAKTQELMQEHQGIFTIDFDQNKKLVEQNAKLNCKKMRNIMAGYVTRLVKKA